MLDPSASALNTDASGEIRAYITGSIAARVRDFIIRFVNKSDIAHEVTVIAVSYMFIFAGAWNDQVLGLTPSAGSKAFEIIMAAVLSLEIVSRLAFAERKTLGFWAVLLLDSVSVLTVLPQIRWIALARLVRMVYASGRLVVLLDRMACKWRNAVYLTGIYPLVIPMMAAVVYAVEKRSPNPVVHNYLQALGMCFAFSLSLGNIRPSSPVAMAICGALFLSGLMCVGIMTNQLSERYHTPRDPQG